MNIPKLVDKLYENGTYYSRVIKTCKKWFDEKLNSKETDKVLFYYTFVSGTLFLLGVSVIRWVLHIQSSIIIILYFFLFCVIFSYIFYIGAAC